MPGETHKKFLIGCNHLAVKMHVLVAMYIVD